MGAYSVRSPATRQKGACAGQQEQATRLGYGLACAAAPIGQHFHVVIDADEAVLIQIALVARHIDLAPVG